MSDSPLNEISHTDLELVKDIKKCIYRLSFEENLDVKTNIIYSLIEMGKTFNLMHRLFNINDLLDSICFSAFYPHHHNNLSTAGCKFLIFLAKDCRWADNFIIEKNIHNQAVEALFNEELDVDPKYIAVFLIKLMEISKESFDCIFSPNLLNFFIMNANKMEWTLNCIQTITSLPSFDNNEALEMIIQFIEEEISNKSLNFTELCISILSNVFFTNCNNTLKERAAQQFFMDLGNSLLDPTNERVCLSVIAYYSNAVYYNDSIVLYLVSSGIIEHISVQIDEFSKIPSVFERCMILFSNCISSESYWKEAKDSLVQYSLLPSRVITYYEMYKQTIKMRIVAYICKFITRCDSKELRECIDCNIVNTLLDELIIDDIDNESNILCALIHFLNQTKTNPSDFAEEIESFNDESIIDRLYEIIDDTSTPNLSQGAQILYNIIEGMKKD